MAKFFKTLLAFLFATASVSFAIMVFSGGALFWHRQFGGLSDDLLENEMAFYASQGYEAGVFLKGTEPNRQCCFWSIRTSTGMKTSSSWLMR